MRMLSIKTSCDPLNFMAVLCLVAASSVATASSLTPGFDRFITAPGAAVDLSFLLPSVGTIGV